MEYKIPAEAKLYESVYGDDFPENQYFVLVFGVIPSKFSNRNNYDVSIIEYFKQLGFIEHFKNESFNRNDNPIYDAIFIHNEKRMLLYLKLVTDKKESLYSVGYIYDFALGNITEQMDFDVIDTFKRTKKKSNINLVKSEHGSLDTEEYDITIPEVDLELNYGSDFIRIHDIMVRRLNTFRDKGIILLHGDPGTGKTSYLKYLTKFIQNKDILFIPPSMAEMLSEPSIIPFLMEKRNSILLIEDGEKVITDRQGNGSSAGVSNILNLTDGILGDCLNIQVIVTFNMEKERIDQALLRKGRLIAEHKFDKLSIDETNRLLKHLNKDYVSDKPLMLADIYNIDVDEVKSTKSGSIIGFKR